MGKGDIVYAGEGMNSSVAVSSFPNGVLTFHVAGKIQASNVPRDMRLQRMLGHLTTLTTAIPRSVLVIGCGAGITAGAVSIDPRVERETIVEIEPLVPQAASAYFSEPNFNVLRNPKVQVRIDDGRHYLMTTKERFDGITVDPLDPWVKGAANLYTKEFLEVMKQHLNRGGVVTMYIQLFETDLEAVKSSVATFFEVFPNGTIWGNPYQGQGHDMVLLGQVEPLRIDLDEMEQRIGYRERRQNGAVARGDRHELAGGSVCDVCGPEIRSHGVAEKRPDQSRPEPANAVPGRARAEPGRRGRHLRRHAGVQALSRGSLRQRRRAGGLVAGGYSPPAVSPHVFGQPSRQASAYNADGARSRISPLLPLKIIG